MFKNIANIDSFLNDGDYSTNIIPDTEELEYTEKLKRVQKVKPTRVPGKARIFSMLLLTAVIGTIAGIAGYHKITALDAGNSLIADMFNENILNEVLPESAAISATSTKREVISVSRAITKPDPFMPYRDLSDSFNAPPKFELLEPPESASEGSDAARVMDVSVSGILYDLYSPSAILNIEGTDHLVKKGDTMSNYQILDINKNSVTVKLGQNVYRAGIGETLTSNTGDIHYNKVSNLDSKFGGKNGK